MPTTASINLPTPKSWDEFEDICLTVIKLRCVSENFNRYGRNGQKQYGVDITGEDKFGFSIGVQCKNTLTSLTEKLIVNEVTKAESFTPPLSILYIATSRPPNAPVQSFIKEISKQRVAKGSFAIGVLFWTDIEQELSKDINELKRFYPQFFDNLNDSKLNYEEKQEKDIENLCKLMNCIDMDSVHHYLESAPKYIKMNFLEHVPHIHKMISNPTFYLYDKELENKVTTWASKWFELYFLIRKAPYTYNVSTDNLIFKFSNNADSKEDIIWKDIVDIMDEFMLLHDNLCKFIYEEYPKVNLNKTSIFARQFYD